jgi:hypothetical protein
MTSERIREIQDSTAYPKSLSVRQALLQVWNECEQEYKWIKVEDELPEVSGFDSHNAVNVKFTINTGEIRECTATLEAVTRHCFENSPIDKRWYVYPLGGHELKTITHWRPINRD